MTWLVEVASLGLSWLSERYHGKPRGWRGFLVVLPEKREQPGESHNRSE